MEVATGIPKCRNNARAFKALVCSFSSNHGNQSMQKASRLN